jgi:DNA-directed RNA polymerase subunit RPC12/RpoP
MSDIKIKCPHCKQPLEAPEEMLGEQINCPSCNGLILLPKPAPLPQPATKGCPYCGEQVLAIAKKCKHCGEILDASLKKQRQVETSVPAPPPLVPSSQTNAEKIIVKPKGEGCFLQTLNVGCMIIFIIIGFIVVFIIAVANS